MTNKCVRLYNLERLLTKYDTKSDEVIILESESGAFLYSICVSLKSSE